jgi:GntR family transcriptional repressor for pyruvate dehydrogenase complex
MFSPLEKKRYSEQVAQLIQEKILRDKLEKGARLPTERKLAQEFQVSRTVIREAIRELEVSGLIKIKKGHTGGIFIADAYHKPLRNSLKNLVSSGKVTVDQIFDVRLLIEPHIAMLAARRAKREDIERLQALMKDSAQHQDDAAVLKQNNLTFHLLLGKASGNPVLSMLIESVIEILVEFSFDFLDLPFEQHFFRVHNDIVQVIAQRKAEEAKRLIEQDVLEVKRKLEGFYGKS